MTEDLRCDFCGDTTDRHNPHDHRIAFQSNNGSIICQTCVGSMSARLTAIKAGDTSPMAISL
jgi:hypothetical protein